MALAARLFIRICQNGTFLGIVGNRGRGRHRTPCVGKGWWRLRSGPLGGGYGRWQGNLCWAFRHTRLNGHRFHKVGNSDSTLFILFCSGALSSSPRVFLLTSQPRWSMRATISRSLRKVSTQSSSLWTCSRSACNWRVRALKRSLSASRALKTPKSL